jgi:hypothetical protein
MHNPRITAITLWHNQPRTNLLLLTILVEYHFETNRIRQTTDKAPMRVRLPIQSLVHIWHKFYPSSISNNDALFGTLIVLDSYTRATGAHDIAVGLFSRVVVSLRLRKENLPDG